MMRSTLSTPHDYTFFAPGQIVFGWGRRREIGRLTRRLGNRAFLVTGSRTLEREGRIAELCAALEADGIEAVRLGSAVGEPVVEDVDRLVAEIRGQEPERGGFVLGIGGGSAIDLAKAVAALATNPHGASVTDFLEGVGKGLSLEHPPLPVAAVPTTAGTGSEATKNAVISCYAPAFKKSLRDEALVPRLVVIDPELAVSVPPGVTAQTGMDAITQLIESYISRRRAPLPQALAVQGLELAIPAIAEAFEHGDSRPAREQMAHAALLSGMALANSGLGMAHGVAAALGVHCRVPHGLACAVMLPVARRVNRHAAARELARLGEVMTGERFNDETAAVDAAIKTVDELCARLGIPRRLSELGVERAQIPELVASSGGNSMSGNPREIPDGELTRILEELL